MDFPHVVLARVYEHIEPLDRGERYEDPLQAVLGQVNLGRVTGGGSQLNELGGIEYADLEGALANLDEEALRVVADALEGAGAPQGSELINAADDRILRQFGTGQCLAIFLDGTSLPDEVYANLDFEVVVTELGAAAGERAATILTSNKGFEEWGGSSETTSWPAPSSIAWSTTATSSTSGAIAIVSENTATCATPSNHRRVTKQTTQREHDDRGRPTNHGVGEQFSPATREQDSPGVDRTEP